MLFLHVFILVLLEDDIFHVPQTIADPQAAAVPLSPASFLAMANEAFCSLVLSKWRIQLLET